MTDPVLIVEDELKIARLLRDYCEQSGFATMMIHDGEEDARVVEEQYPRG